MVYSHPFHLQYQLIFRLRFPRNLSPDPDSKGPDAPVSGLYAWVSNLKTSLSIPGIDILTIFGLSFFFVILIFQSTPLSPTRKNSTTLLALDWSAPPRLR